MAIFPKRWRKHYLFYEGVLVACLGSVSVIYGYRYGGNHVIDGLLGDSRETFYNALASIFASLFGFVIAATSIVLGVSGNARLAVVRESNGYKDLWRTLFSAIKWLGVATLVALSALVLDRQDDPTYWITHAVLILTVLVVLRLWRCVWILQETIKLVTRRPRGETVDTHTDHSTRVESRSTP